MNLEYLLRLDDACPTMSKDKWERIEQILSKYGICPMVGVVPNNEDKKLIIDPFDINFWDKVKMWENKGWSIALHGYDHCYISQKAGINPFWNRSEFAGVALDIQKDKIHKGIAVLEEHDISPKYFFAPSHTYDNNTLEALKTESTIRVISDSIGTKPYTYKGFVFIPQIIGHCTVPPISGVWTFCLHPNTMKEEDFKATELFLKEHYHEFTRFDLLDLSEVKSKSLFDRFLSKSFFAYRRIRGLK